MSGALLLTLDLDGPEDYAGIHGQPLPPDFDPLVMYGAPLERFVELCRGVGAPATLFVVSRDLETASAARLRALAGAGFEIASHSATHDYRLSRLPPAIIRDEVESSVAALHQAVGVRPRGFRAPGYHLSAALLDALEQCGLDYDSSVMPSLPYYLGKAAVLALYRATARFSTAILGSPRLCSAPRQPYRPGRDPYSPGDRALVELPIAVAGPLGLPVTGAVLGTVPFAVRFQLVRWLSTTPVIILNFHGMDLIDAERDGLPAVLRPTQPELRVPLARRLATFQSLLAGLAAGRRLLTCAALAEHERGRLGAAARI